MDTVEVPDGLAALVMPAPSAPQYLGKFWGLCGWVEGGYTAGRTTGGHGAHENPQAHYGL